jgi:hypothetical protein
MFNVGDRVTATVDMGERFSTYVRKGTHGVVVEVRSDLFTRWYLVRFDDGETRECNKYQIA